MSRNVTNDKAYYELAEQLVDLQKRLDGLSTSQLAHSSLENTGLPVYSPTGQLSGMMGRLPDGSYGTATLSGPVPPIPSVPLVQAVRGVGLEITWDGLFADAQAVVPLEGGRLEVYISEDPNITPVMVPAYSMGSPRGEKFLISVGYDKIHYVAFAFRAASGKVSPCSAVVGPATVGRATKEDLEVNFDELRGTRIFYGPDEPETTQADLWLRDNPDGTQTALRFDPGTATEPGEWIEVRDQGIVEALAEARAANEAATSAGLAALAAQQTADGKTTIYRQASPPTGAALGSYWIDADDNVPYRWEGESPSWVKVQDTNINTAITNAATAKAIADGKMRIFTQPTPPIGLLAEDVGDLWIDTDDSNLSYTWDLITEAVYGWVPRRLGNGAIEPKSLVASNVIATGTVTAALFEALLVLATELIAGDPLGSHARMTPQGFRVYREDELDGVPDEVVRMGTDTNDYFGIVDSQGNLVAAIDDTGRATFREVNTQKIIVGGRDLSVALTDGPRGEVAFFLNQPGFDLAPIFNPVGVAEVGFQVEKGRSYTFRWRCFIFANAGVQIQANGRWTQGNDGDVQTPADAPTINSQSFAEWRMFPAGDNKVQTFEGESVWVAQRTTRVRLGLTIQTGPDGGIGFVGLKNAPVEIAVNDVGRHVYQTGQHSNMGGSLHNTVTPPPPPAVIQNHYVDLAPAARQSWNGSGQHMTWAGNDVYQGYQSSNGNTRGQFVFNLPPITGWVSRVDLWLYFRHWHFNGGGTAIIGLTDQRHAFTDHSFAPKIEVAGYPKPGGREIMLPTEWNGYFRGTDNNAFNGRATVISLGPGAGTNQIHYGVATDARLRIHYTQ